MQNSYLHSNVNTFINRNGSFTKWIRLKERESLLLSFCSFKTAGDQAGERMPLEEIKWRVKEVAYV